jgi:hypothetical protein
MKFSLNYEFGGKQKRRKLPEQRYLLPVLIASSSRFGCESPEMDSEPLCESI